MYFAEISTMDYMCNQVLELVGEWQCNKVTSN